MMSERKWIAYKRVLRYADVVIHIVDARDVPGTLDRDMSKYKSKMIVAINKADLVSPSSLRTSLARFKTWRCVATSNKTGRGYAELLKLAQSISPRPQPKVAVVGYPNVGKSSLLNKLGGRKVARVSPIPGETRGPQWVKSGGFLFIDTPGVIPPRDQGGKDLILKGALRVEHAPDPESIAEEVIARFLPDDAKALAKCYDITVAGKDTSQEILEKIALRRGKLLRGGKLNLFETAQMVVRDYQTGKLRSSF